MLDQAQLKLDVLAGKVTWREAFALLTEQGSKAWTSPEWKALREQHLDPSCVQCGSDEPPLVIQHMWHPRAIQLIFDVVKLPYYAEYEAMHPKPVLEKPMVHRAVGTCPVCGSAVIRYRRTDRTWKCQAQQNKQRCGAVFEQPVPGSVARMDPTKVDAYEVSVRAAYREWHLAFEAAYGDVYGPIAIVQSIDEHLRYISFVDAVTFCKKCAFLWDVKGLKLCAECREHYHNRAYPRCFACSQKLREGEGKLG